MQRQVFQFKEYSVQHYTTGLAGKAYIYADSTIGGAVTDQTGGGDTLAISTGPVTATFPLDGTEGTTYRFDVTPGATGVTRVYGATLKVRPIGVYLVGANGDVFKTQEIALGI